jgi:Flp pilus assembly pilin Flp
VVFWLWRKVMKRFFKDEKGLETVEYAIIAGLIVVGVIVTIGTIGGYVKARFDALATALQ